MVKKLTEICVKCLLLLPSCKQIQNMFTDFGILPSIRFW